VEWLNYHHLLYFWMVAREGNLTRASRELHLTPQTVSAQIRALEESLGERLFDRPGRRLVLTETGRLAYGYAEEIFGLGRELRDALRGRVTGRPVELVVGVVDVLPKLVAHQLIRPALEMGEPVRIVCREASAPDLLAQLAVHRLDVVLSDTPIPPGMSLRAFNHLLGECGVTFFAARELAAKLRRRFPASLDDVPVLLPTEDSVLRRSLDQWFDSRGIRPRAVAEFQDSALLKVFGQAGLGVFCAPAVLETAVRRQYGVRVVGRTDEVVERFYAISGERRIRHPAVAALCDTARTELFGG
jgi:LysR family transcriptional activator of nhaA